jgi:hypothetical protein
MQSCYRLSERRRELSARKSKQTPVVPFPMQSGPVHQIHKTRRRAKMLVKVTNEHQKFVNAAQTEMEKESHDAFATGLVVS